jgi:hypothetical protein
MAEDQESSDNIPQKFTSELHGMLCDLEYNSSSSSVASDSKDIIRWEPDGKSFVMFDR